MRNRIGIVVTISLAAVAMVVILATWLGGADWRKLLLFAGIVCVAAWGRGLEARVPSKRPADEAIDEAAQVGGERPAP